MPSQRLVFFKIEECNLFKLCLESVTLKGLKLLYYCMLKIVSAKLVQGKFMKVEKVWKMKSSAKSNTHGTNIN